MDLQSCIKLSLLILPVSGMATNIDGMFFLSLQTIRKNIYSNFIYNFGRASAFFTFKALTFTNSLWIFESYFYKSSNASNTPQHRPYPP